MASAGYTIATVNALMELVDDNQESLNEHVYLQMCNALKDLHKSTVSSGPSYQSNVDFQSDVDFQRQRYTQFIARQRALLARPHLFPRITVLRKMDAIKRNHPSVYSTVYREYNIYTTKCEVCKAIEGYLKLHGIHTDDTLNAMYTAHLNTMDAQRRSRINAKIVGFELHLARLG